MPLTDQTISIDAINIFKYTLPLRAPLRLATGIIDKREGLLVKLTSKSGHYGIGEIAPLPGFHREGLEEVQQQLKSLFARWLPIEWDDNRQGLHRLLQELETFGVFPSLRGGVEMAVLHLLAKIHHSPLCKELNSSFQPTIPLQALLVGDSLETITQEAKRCLHEGYRAFKLKVGRNAPEEDAERVLAIREVIGKEACLRLDANREWTLSAAIRFGQRLQGTEIDFIEEPLREASDHALFYSETHLPVALDESLSTQKPSDFPKPSEGIVALVLKPALLGGWYATQQWIEVAQKHKLNVILSSMFETALGCAFLANVAACIEQELTPMGLDTGKWFAADLIPEQLVEKGQIDAIRAYKLTSKQDILDKCEELKEPGDLENS